jgi:predicted ATP-binding protein involved in virulence
VAAWVGDLLFNITNAFNDRKDPLKTRGLLLIDEIDLHLHPKWQRLLHMFIKKKLPNFQIVATTHSPLTAQQAEEGELYALKREKKKVNLVAFVGNPSKMLIHQILMSPVFGLPTDESVEVEKAKTANREKRIKQYQSSTEASVGEFSPDSDILRDSPLNVRTNSLLTDQQLGVLESINRELKKQK